MSAGDNGKYKRPSNGRQMTVKEKVLKSRLSSLAALCLLPGMVCNSSESSIIHTYIQTHYGL